MVFEKKEYFHHRPAVAKAMARQGSAPVKREIRFNGVNRKNVFISSIGRNHPGETKDEKVSLGRFRLKKRLTPSAGGNGIVIV